MNEKFSRVFVEESSIKIPFSGMPCSMAYFLATSDSLESFLSQNHQVKMIFFTILFSYSQSAWSIRAAKTGDGTSHQMAAPNTIAVSDGRVSSIYEKLYICHPVQRI